MKRTTVLLLSLFANSSFLLAQTTSLLPFPSNKPGKYQAEQIKRKYGMFIHFGINTFHNQEWTDGSLPALSYNPSTIDAEQWVKTAKDAGMKYVILVTKHHEGFCLWNSQFTEYDVNSSSNTTDVVEKVAKACKKYHIGLGLYYSLWDRHQNPDTANVQQDSAYNQYMIDQINELIAITKKAEAPIVEFWFDGSWCKQNTRWPTEEIYKTIKSKEPQCQVGINWSIGLPGKPGQHFLLPDQQKEGYPIVYFPSDFRLGDPYLPSDPDPKIFTYNNERYYMPWESTICISSKWFYHTEDTLYKPMDQLIKAYKTATAQDNILIINTPPDRQGKIRKKDIETLMELKKAVRP